ncbi:Doubled CXXCH motif (Paired_CXXCH_1) [Anatilimnocola aggregata]|uniref:Doubled CXXCH motif (Paired_CXXCH_1) n=2 Tax=Anatilimnocola aggregata TaxID=2528021 RepID=A0A517YKI5_9BACT|nr:Doubled CXXCH motif (Paired_CXXCH_1) [Anatilimnocola aggregata]
MAVAIIAWQMFRAPDPQLLGEQVSLPIEKSPIVATLNERLECYKYLPDEVARADATHSEFSNVLFQDYVRPESCGKCHAEQFRQWQQHPHARMNAAANDQTVVGSFQGDRLSLQGGVISMFTRDKERFVRLQRGDLDRTFCVSRTIGSRIFQFYVGKLVAGAPLPDQSVDQSALPDQEVVLPVGYWITRKKWVPAYDVFDFIDHDQPTSGFDLYDRFKPVRYYERCSLCHTTLPEADRLLLDTYPPAGNRSPLQVSLWPLLEQSLPRLVANGNTHPALNEQELLPLLDEMRRQISAERTVSLGISCEACHFGGREHAQANGKAPPRFVPCSPHLVEASRVANQLGRTPSNINHVCGRCHSAVRDLHPSGESHKNSAEFRDAIAGSCYSQLKCTDCHEPHTATGTKWGKTAEQDDNSCLRCHEKLSSPGARAAHTHHSAGSRGDRCMNCHMPHTTEGLEDVVRTHRISSPTDTANVLTGSANACNLCHLDKSTAWTLSRLNDWYGRTFSKDDVKGIAPDNLAGREYLSSPIATVRFSGLAAAKRQQAKWLLPEIIKELDAPKLVHRQFAHDAVEALLQRDLERDFGYRFWMTPTERREVLPAVGAAAQQGTVAPPDKTLD